MPISPPSNWKLSLLPTLLLTAAAGWALMATTATANPVEDTATMPVAAHAQGERVYRHVVLFKFAETATAEQIAGVVRDFAALPSKIPQIQSFEWGTDISPEKKSQGFTHCFLLTFAGTEELEVYLPHPDHKAFGASLKGLIADVLVVDYWTQK